MSAEWHLLPSPIVLQVSGKDARRYLNNRLSNDLRSLQPGESIRAAALSAQGRVEGLFTIWAQPNDLFFLVCDGGDRDAVRTALARFIVADRVTVDDISDRACVLHVVQGLDSIRPTIEALSPERLLSAPASRLSDAGTDCVVVGVARADVERQLGAGMSPESYARERVRYGTPTFPEEINGDSILTEAGLYDAVSFSKGCYVGQEVIERSDAIGKLPRTLERIKLEGAASVEAGAPLTLAAGETIGKVVTAVSDTASKCTFLFALLRSGKYGNGDSVLCDGRRGEILPRSTIRTR